MQIVIGNARVQDLRDVDIVGAAVHDEQIDALGVAQAWTHGRSLEGDAGKVVRHFAQLVWNPALGGFPLIDRRDDLLGKAR